jgi:hypothetical protein
VARTVVRAAEDHVALERGVQQSCRMDTTLRTTLDPAGTP